MLYANKINVLFLGAQFKPLNTTWGGTIATSYVLNKSFINHDKYNIIFIPRTEIKCGNDIKNVIQSNPHSILHVDDTRLLNLFYDNNIPAPDVIGPITRSPIKTYGEWKSNYDKDYFYSAKVIRLNKTEEYIANGKIDYTDKIFYINHGVDTDYLTPSNENKNIILWAGDIGRKAKGYELWQEIQKNIVLPNGYNYVTLSGYKIEDYWKLLNNVKIIVNTSLNESFCSAMFEAKSKGIPSIYRKNLHNGRHLDGRIQVDYTVDKYGYEILKLLSDKDYYNQEAIASRKFTVDNFSLKKMCESYCNIYDLIIKENK